ncbi:MAG: M2 family metallopeptidase [Maricaulaceae bacterium]
MRKLLLVATSLTALAISACNADEVKLESSTDTGTIATTNYADKPATIQDAKEFIEQAEKDLIELGEYAARIYWVNANFITDDTRWLAQKAGAEGAKLSTRLANEAKKFNDLVLPADMARKLDMLKRGSNFPAPEIDGAPEELSGIMTNLDAAYSTGTFEHNGKVLSLFEATDIIAKSRDPEELAAVWAGWREISPKMKDNYGRMVSIINQGSLELGYADAGALWRSGYDMPADDFVNEADRLWGQVKPLYDELHCHVRAKLNENYGDTVVPLDQPIRADLLGNMWGQQWGNIYDLVAPENAEAGVNATKLLEENDYTALKMVKVAEIFFTSMGFEDLPETFWRRSLITKPRDREVACHASAWDIDNEDDIRIKMCTKVTAEDFQTVHHELGHNFYQRAYKNQSIIYRDGANDGFHEAIGDMIALSITPNYLVEIGLLGEEDKPSADADLSLLMRSALDKIAFLPFGLMVDQWRWNVFNGEYSPEEYNKGWWELREKYQGLKPPVNRSEADFDPGAKYHIPGNTPYMRYFLAHILQFQFHKAACDMSGYEGALHSCSVYGNKTVGSRFNAMMELGSSKPWPDALEAFTGTRDMDGGAIIEYYAPLIEYLKEQNKDRTCGW